MNTSQALIVDDSKTAQHLLKRMLQKFNLKIDVVSSAEEALAYLSYNHPAVIFLDQQMTGMTGIEALKTIKANPHTALIPVIMYTSREDDLFVSQAIALGAQGIFSKSAMQPANLERVLLGLNIRSSGAKPAGLDEAEVEAQTTIEATAITAPIAAQDQTVATKSEVAATLPQHELAVPGIDQVRSQIGRLFEIHIAEVRNQINNSTQFIVKRVAANFDKNSNREAVISNTSLSAVKSVVKNVIGAERKRISLTSNALLAVVVLMMGFFGYELMQIQGELSQTSKNYQETVEAKKQEILVAAAAVTAGQSTKKNQALLRAIGWAQNTDFQFNYGEPPLNDIQLANLNNIVYILADGGYKGALIVDINFGNVCLEPGGTTGWRLARNDLSASSCKMLRDLNPKFSAADYINPAYQSFERSALALQDGRINIQLVSSGISVPRVEYPIIGATSTAGEWNRAALRNNRISIRFPN